MTATYEVTATRDGSWWMVAIPALGGLTQARRLAEAPQMAREWIALTLGVAPGDIEVTVTVAQVGGVDVAGQLAAIRARREQAADMDREASAAAARLARALADQDVPVRDIGTALGVSFQRAHQLIKATARQGTAA
jgi:predicted RNase H-like HicB family nuclease